MKSWKVIQSAVSMLAVIGLLAACTDRDLLRDDSKSSNSGVVDARQVIDDPDLSKIEKSNKLVSVGEQLFTPESFFLSAPVFDAALEQNSNNSAALFYSAILKPMMNMRGIMARIEPLMKKDPSRYNSYKRALDNKNFTILKKDLGLRGYYNETLEIPGEFLADGENLPLITSENELLDFVYEQVSAYDELRQFFNANKELSFTTKISERWYSDRAGSRKNVCRYTKIHDLAVQIDCEENPKFMEVKIDRGEVVVFKSAAAGLAIIHTISSAYDLTGMQKVIAKLRGKSMASEQFLIESTLNQNDQIATLRDQQSLKTVLAMGVDGMLGARWVKDNQETLCPPPVEGSAFVKDGFQMNRMTQKMEQGKKHLLREGHLFDEGICTHRLDPRRNRSQLEKLFDTIDLALTGGIITISGEKVARMDRGQTMSTGEKATAEVKPAVLFNSPIQDLRDIRPTNYNACGNIKALSDSSLGGVFVNDDAQSYLYDINHIGQDDGFCEVEL